MRNYFAKNTPSDTELVTRCLNGNADAWQQLIDRYSGLVHSVPVRHGLTPAEVDDIGQETFLALARNLHTLDDPERLGAWLVTTARRFSWRLLQRRKREQTAAQADLSESEVPLGANFVGTTVPSVDELFQGWSRQVALAQGMTHLSDRCRELLTLLFLTPEEPSYDEICAQLNIAKGSIGPTRNRCLKQLRSILEGMDFFEE